MRWGCGLIASCYDIMLSCYDPVQCRRHLMSTNMPPDLAPSVPLLGPVSGPYVPLPEFKGSVEKNRSLCYLSQLKEMQLKVYFIVQYMI
jgi:hypothetical protein